MNKVLTINRAKWTRGVLNLPSKLLNSAGYMCCLGFDALACGVPSDVLDGIGEPYELADSADVSYLRDRVNYNDSDDDDPTPLNSVLVDKAIDINDDLEITDNEREAKLIPILKQLGWDEVRFVDRVP